MFQFFQFSPELLSKVLVSQTIMMDTRNLEKVIHNHILLQQICKKKFKNFLLKDHDRIY